MYNSHTCACVSHSLAAAAATNFEMRNEDNAAADCIQDEDGGGGGGGDCDFLPVAARLPMLRLCADRGREGGRKGRKVKFKKVPMDAE